VKKTFAVKALRRRNFAAKETLCCGDRSWLQRKSSVKVSICRKKLSIKERFYRRIGWLYVGRFFRDFFDSLN